MANEFKLVQRNLQLIYKDLGLEDKGKVQKFLDNKVVQNLMQYVSFKTGAQEKSIPISSDYGSGKVHINVPYAEYQAYSKRIKKRVGKRGTRPFERMKSDEGSRILSQTISYARRISK